MANQSEGEECSVAVSLHAADPDRIDMEVLARAVAAAIVATGDLGLRVVVSGAFEEYVRENDAPTGGAYVQAKVRGQAAGYIVTTADGSRELLIDASVVAVDRDAEQDPVRVFMHEALHLVIDDRGESTHYRRARLGYRAGTADGAFAGIAGRIGEEYRVERALREAGHPLEPVYREQLDALAADYAATLVGPLSDHQAWPTPDRVEALLTAAAPGFEDLTPIVAYLIGDDVGSGERRPPAVGEGTGGWFAIGYDLLYGPLSALPSATTPCTVEELDALLDPVAEAVREWFAAIGFRWTGGPINHRLQVSEDLAAALSFT